MALLKFDLTEQHILDTHAGKSQSQAVHAARALLYTGYPIDLKEYT